jgi:hypothetical protein
MGGGSVQQFLTFKITKRLEPAKVGAFYFWGMLFMVTLIGETLLEDAYWGYGCFLFETLIVVSNSKSKFFIFKNEEEETSKNTLVL